MPEASARKGICFVISPIGPEGSDVRRRSDQVLAHIITPVAAELGYETIRADKISEPGMITSQVIQHLVDDPLVVADLSGHNPNVFYELAVRHAVRKPVVQLIQVGEAIPFDVAQTRTVQYDHRDLDVAARCRDELREHIKAIEKDPAKVDTPVSIAVDVKSLRSGSPLEKSTAEILSLLQDLNARLSAMGSWSLGPATRTSTPATSAILGAFPALNSDDDVNALKRKLAFWQKMMIEKETELAVLRDAYSEATRGARSKIEKAEFIDSLMRDKEAEKSGTNQKRTA